MFKGSVLSRGVGGAPRDEADSFSKRFIWMSELRARWRFTFPRPELMSRFTHRLSALWRSIAAARRPGQPFPMGISARLTLALVAVAALAATANFIVSRSAVLFRANGQSSPLVVNPQPQPDASAKEAPTVDRRTMVGMAVAIDRFEWTSRRRAARQSNENTAENLEAAAQLRASASSFQREFGPLRPDETASVARAVSDYIGRGQKLVQTGDRARASWQEYAQRLRSMDRRVAASLDDAWHIFGRVVARQSLMKFRSDLDSLARRAQEFNEDGPIGPQQDTALASLENELTSGLSAKPGTLQKSQGSQWAGDMQTDLNALAALRRESEILRNAYAAATLDFIHQSDALFSQVQIASTDAPVRRAALVHARIFPATSYPLLSPPLSSAAPLPHDAMDYSILKQADPRARAAMAAVTAVVMLLIAAISLLTVRSVLVPVRRILQATRRLAEGDSEARVLPGGMRELANLAVAFNGMAERLAAAQSDRLRQQESLEAQVLERTRKLRQLAEKDPLTSLANRRQLFGRLNSAIADAARDRTCLGVYFLDIDNFKNYNDSLGHVFGDRVLMSVANRLEEITEGVGFVARFGGDEFTVLLERADGLESILAFGHMLVRAFHELLPVDDRELSVSISVGASAYPMHAQDVEDLLRAADSALFRAKELGRSQVAMFTPQLTESAEARFSTEQGLRRALEHGDFELVYQPEVELSTFEMGSVEALLRWRMPDGKVAKPGEFLAIAEQSGLIVEINDWVLKTAVRDAAAWHHGEWPESRVAINVTPRQVLDERFADRLLALLNDFRLPPRCIELELTESVLQTGSNTVAALKNLLSKGFGIALDDFGTGYSSLTSLEQLPLSRIKMDRSLIVNVGSNPRAAAIATAILRLCAALELEVTVEGVERIDQFSWLLGQRGVCLQGYLISEPTPREEILSLKYSMVQKMQDLLFSVRPAQHGDCRVPPAQTSRRMFGPSGA